MPGVVDALGTPARATVWRLWTSRAGTRNWPCTPDAVGNFPCLLDRPDVDGNGDRRRDRPAV